MSHSMLLSTRDHISFDSSNPRFSVLTDKLGFIAGLLTNTVVFATARCRPSPNSASLSIFFVGWSISDGTPPVISTSPVIVLFCIPLAVCVNSFSSFSSDGDVARLFRTGSMRPENDPVGVGGDTISSSSNSGDDKSTSGDGDNSLLRSASASSDLDAALDMDGEIIARCWRRKGLFAGSGIG